MSRKRRWAAIALDVGSVLVVAPFLIYDIARDEAAWAALAASVGTICVLNLMAELWDW